MTVKISHVRKILTQSSYKVSKIKKIKIDDPSNQYFECRFDDPVDKQKLVESIESKSFMFKSAIINFKIKDSNKILPILKKMKFQNFYETIGSSFPRLQTSNYDNNINTPSMDCNQYQESLQNEGGIYNINWIIIGSDSEEEEQEIFFEKELDHTDDNIRYNLDI